MEQSSRSSLIGNMNSFGLRYAPFLKEHSVTGKVSNSSSPNFWIAAKFDGN